MSPGSALIRCLMSLCLLIAVSHTVQAQSSSTAPDALRPLMATALQSVQTLLAAGKTAEAQATLRDVDQKIRDRSLFETYVFERLRAAAAVAAGDEPGALKFSEAAINTGKASPEERRGMLSQMVGFALKAKDHEATLKWARAYLEDGGTDEGVRSAVVRAALAKGDCGPAVDQLTVLIAAVEKRNEKPQEALLRAQVGCQAKLGSDQGYYRELERLITHHPRKEYWADLIARLQRKAGFPDRLLLDTFRLMRHVGAMEDADDFTSAAQLSMLAALPGEAQAFLKAGVDAGVLGKGPAGATHRELLAKATRAAEADRAQLGDAEKQAAAGSQGRPLFLVGQAAWSYGQHDRAVPLMERALRLGVAPQPNDAQLHFALALASAGQSDRARSVLQGLAGQDGWADLARLWLIALR